MKIFLLLPAIYLAGNIYLFIHFLKQFGNTPLVLKIALSSIFWTAASSLFISLFLRDANLPVWLSKSLYLIGSIWMVFTLYMVISLLAADILRMAIPLIRQVLSKYGFIMAFAITAGLLVYGYCNYRNPRINEIEILINKNDNLVSELNSNLAVSPNSCDTSAKNALRIVAVSDVHLGNGTGKGLLHKYVQMINAQSPDIVLIVGDLIDNSVEPLYRDNMALELSRLTAPMGIYMVPGNHEYISGISKVEEFLKNTPIKLLKDSVVTLPCGITIIGRDDRSNRSRKSLEELLCGISHENRASVDSVISTDSSECTSSAVFSYYPAILLDHQPYDLAKTDSLGITLQISGHTHRGQVWPLNWLTDNLYEQSHGYRKWNNSHIYVSSGLSLWGPPFRIGTESEIVVVELEKEPATPL